MEFEISFINQPNIAFFISINKNTVNNVCGCLFDDITAMVNFEKVK